MTHEQPKDILKSTEWLSRNLSDPKLRILDCSFHLPGTGREARIEFERAHIPGAAFFDIDAVCDREATLPHMLPTAAFFEQAVGDLGISNDNLVVLYDAAGSMGAARVWWTFRVFGHRNISLLDGGLSKWDAEGRETESQVRTRPTGRFVARYDPDLVSSADQIRQTLVTGHGQIIDNRPARRFLGLDPEPRPVRRRGHIPGSMNIPFDHYIRPDEHNQWKPVSELRSVFSASGIDLNGPLVASCGSGVTAATTAFAACLLGHENVSVYDGSWAEWGNRDDTPVQEGQS